MKIFIILKKKSERIKNKNFVKFNKLELYKKVLYKFKDFEVFVDTDSEKIIREGKKDKRLSHCFFYKRNKEFISMEKNLNKSPTPLMIKKFLSDFVTKNNEIVVTSHVTSPFLKISTLNDALSKMKNYNSVVSCIKTQNFTYVKKKELYKPVNFNKNVIQKTQTLPYVITLVGAFFIIKKNIFLKNGLQRISSNNYFYPLDFPENIDIDNYSDLNLALKINKSKNFL